MAKDYYKILGVDKNASEQDIKNAYRTLAKKYHPDVNKDKPDAEAKFKDINEAYSVLSDSQKRANYDQFGTADGAGFGGGGFGGFNAESFGGFEDIFNIFSGFGNTRASTASRRETADDLVVNMTISFEEAALGVEKEIILQRLERCSACSGTGAKNINDKINCPECGGTGKIQYTQNTMFGQIRNVATCNNCNGTGKIFRDKCPNCRGKGTEKQTKHIKVKIPAGIDDAQTIKMRGEGDQTASANGQAGDLLVNVKVLPHKLLVRHGFDLFVDAYVPFTTLLLGGKVEIPVVSGTMKLDIPALTQSNTKFTLKGKGIKFLRGNGSGDLVVTLKGEVPKDLDRNTKKIIQEWQDSIKPSDYPKTTSFKNKLNN